MAPRPPKLWWQRCVAGVEASGGAKERLGGAPAVCGATWRDKPLSEKIRQRAEEGAGMASGKSKSGPAPDFKKCYPNDPDLARRAKFFWENSGWSHDPKKETERHGRMRGAMQAAEAEDEAYNRGWRTFWEDDPEGWDSIGDIPPEDIREVLWARLVDENNRTLASLGSIVFGRGESGEDNRRYGEVVEAELALQALSEAGWKWTPPKGFK